MDNLFLFFVVAVISFIVGYLIGKISKYLEIRKERKNAVKRSKSVILGESYEKLAPFMPNVKYFPKDMNFLGKGVDYIIFDGLSSGDLKEIVLLEVKTGKSRLNKNERQIKNIIDKKKIRYEVIYLDR